MEPELGAEVLLECLVPLLSGHPVATGTCLPTQCPRPAAQPPSLHSQGWEPWGPTPGPTCLTRQDILGPVASPESGPGPWSEQDLQTTLGGADCLLSLVAKPVFLASCLHVCV